MRLDDRVTIATPEGVTLELVLAGLGSRFLARLLDSVIQGAIIIALTVGLAAFNAGTNVGGGVLVGIVLGVVIGAQPIQIVVITIGTALLGYFTPNMVVYQLAYNRSEQLRRELPDALDLLTITVEAGLGHMGIHRNLIHPKFGNFVLLGTVLVEAEVPNPNAVLKPGASNSESARIGLFCRIRGSLKKTGSRSSILVASRL